LDIPAFVTIESIDTNPNYKERDFLEKARIFPIKVELTIRSYQVQIDGINKVYQLPIKWNGIKKWKKPDEIYFSQKVVLDWASSKFDLDKVATTENNSELNLNTSLYYNGNESDLEDLGLKMSTINSDTWDIVKGYFQETQECTLNSYSIDTTKTTSSSLTIKFAVKPADYKYFNGMDILIPGHEKIQITNCKQTSVEIPGLYPNSKYEIKMITNSISEVKTTYTLSASTLDDVKNLAPSSTEDDDGNISISKIIRKGNSLIGQSF